MPDMKEGGVNVTPLIDIVMCLIVFFMMVAKIGVTRGVDPKIVPPSTLLGVKIKDMSNTITLNVRDWENVHKEEIAAAQKAGIPEAQWPAAPMKIEREHPRVQAIVHDGEEPKELAVLTSGGDRPLRRVLTELSKAKPNFRVIIVADANIRYDLLQQVLIDCSQAKVKDFNFQMKQGK
jgi:biopolymer transport protein ExbD